MGRNGSGIVLAATVGIILLGGIAAGILVSGPGARTGQGYLEDNVKVSEGKDSSQKEAEKNGTSERTGMSEKTSNPDQLGIIIEDEGQEKVPAGAAQESVKGLEGLNGGPGVESSAAEESDPHGGEIVMLFAGDVYFSDHVLNAYDKAGGIHGVLDDGIREEIGKADIFMVNQEFPFTQRGTAAADKQFTFRVPESRMHLMQEMGVDMVTLANNHILDFGEAGLLDSCKALDEAGIPYVGGGENLERAKELKTVVIGNRTIGFLGMSRVYMAASWAAGDSHPGVFSTYDTTLPLKAIAEAREACDYLVVYVHWGVERETTPKDYQRAMGRAYIDAGADLVVGSHPHVLQEPEIYEGKPIVYSLGNFVFGSSIPETALLKVIWNGEEAEISMIPCTSSGGFTRMVR